MRGVALSMSLFCVAGLANAEGASDDVVSVRTCFASAATVAEAGCIGTLAETCSATTDGGETTLGIVQCMQREAAAWDVLLNEEYGASRAWAKEADAAEAAYFPEFAHFADALRDAQRAWIAFRDAECGLAYASWGSGSMRTIAGADCQMTMTAHRAFDLRALREEQ